MSGDPFGELANTALFLANKLIERSAQYANCAVNVLWEMHTPFCASIPGCSVLLCWAAAPTRFGLFRVKIWTVGNFNYTATMMMGAHSMRCWKMEISVLSRSQLNGGASPINSFRHIHSMAIKRNGRRELEMVEKWPKGPSLADLLTFTMPGFKLALIVINHVEMTFLSWYSPLKFCVLLSFDLCVLHWILCFLRINKQNLK